MGKLSPRERKHELPSKYLQASEGGRCVTNKYKVTSIRAGMCARNKSIMRRVMKSVQASVDGGEWAGKSLKFPQMPQ